MRVVLACLLFRFDVGVAREGICLAAQMPPQECRLLSFSFVSDKISKNNESVSVQRVEAFGSTNSTNGIFV